MVNRENLFNKWVQLCHSHTSDEELISSLWQEIEAAHESKGRHYHNLNHLAHLAGEIEEVEERLHDPETIWFALFYHDIVYSATAKDNEEKSAALAVERLSEVGLSHQSLQKIHSHIILTKTHQPGGDPDSPFLLDADLAILGAEPVKYHDYTRQVRKEYSIYPGFLYKKGRKKVIRHFLEMDRIYKTDHFNQKYEAKARQNLARELTSL